VLQFSAFTLSSGCEIEGGPSCRYDRTSNFQDAANTLDATHNATDRRFIVLLDSRSKFPLLSRALGLLRHLVKIVNNASRTESNVGKTQCHRYTRGRVIVRMAVSEMKRRSDLSVEIVQTSPTL
jgi:hypothetical protein